MTPFFIFLIFADFFFVVLHLAITAFNLLGWIWRRTLRWHLLSILLTAASWFLLGIYYGIGYCPITDWHWHIKRKLGAEVLPHSFITWFAQQIWPVAVNQELIYWLTVIGFTLAALMSFYRNMKIGTFTVKR